MTKEIPLTQGQVALVDDELYPFLSKYKWTAYWFPNSKYYVAARSVGDKIVYMHRIIMMAPEGLEVDHKNHNGLDNRMVNLRLCTSRENHRNRSKQKSNGSQFKGVRKSGAAWLAQFQGKQIGRFLSEEAAAMAYDIAAVAEFGAFANTNFGPDEGPADYEDQRLPAYLHISHRNPKSGYRGVYQHGPTGRWTARVRRDNQMTHLGYYDSPEDAAKAYDAKARELYGQHAVLNFPEESTT